MTPLDNYNKAFIRFLIIATIFLFILACLLPAPAEAQDSVTLRVQRIRTADGKYHVWLKDDKKRKQYVTVCDCAKLPDEIRKGNIVKVAKNKITIIKEIYKDSELEY